MACPRPRTSWATGSVISPASRSPTEPVCAGHTAPFDLFAHQVLERPSLALWHGPRGSGKSFLSAIDTHLCSRFHPAARDADPGRVAGPVGADLPGPRRGRRATAGATCGSDAARDHPAAQDRGPLRQRVAGGHPRRQPDQRPRAARPQPQARRGRRDRPGPPRVGPGHGDGDPRQPGQRADDLDLAPPGRARCRRWSSEARAASSRSSPTASSRSWSAVPRRGAAARLEKCPACPLMPWCHEDRDADPRGRPKAKRSRGHYAIDSLIQKVKAVSPRVFASDYLCQGPRAEGVWFTEYDEAGNVTPARRVRPGASGAHRHRQRRLHRRGLLPGARGRRERRHVLAPARAGERLRRLPGRGPDRRGVRPGHPGPGRPALRLGPQAGLHRFGRRRAESGRSRRSSPSTSGAAWWARGASSSGPSIPAACATAWACIENLIRSADGTVRLTIHPRCKHLDAALAKLYQGPAGRPMDGLSGRSPASARRPDRRPPRRAGGRLSRGPQAPPGPHPGPGGPGVLTVERPVSQASQAPGEVAVALAKPSALAEGRPSRIRGGNHHATCTQFRDPGLPGEPGRHAPPRSCPTAGRSTSLIPNGSCISSAGAGCSTRGRGARPTAWPSTASTSTACRSAT